MSEDKLEMSIAKGVRAEALLRSDVFNDAISGLQTQLTERWRLTTDPQERERIWHCVNLVEQVKHAIVNVANNGKLSQRELHELTGAKTKRFGII